MSLSFSVKTSARSEMVDVTSSVQKEISKAGVSNGICVVYVPHTTAGITINEGAGQHRLQVERSHSHPPGHVGH